MKTLLYLLTGCIIGAVIASVVMNRKPEIKPTQDRVVTIRFYDHETKTMDSVCYHYSANDSLKYAKR